MAVYCTTLDVLFFFFAGAFTFSQRTDILIQCGVSREKQYGVLWALGIIAVPAALLNGALQGMRAAVYAQTFDELFLSPMSSLTEWYSAPVCALLCGAVFLLEDLAAMFAGNLVGILLYRFLRAGSRLNILLPIVLVWFLPIGLWVLPTSYDLSEQIAAPAPEFMDSALRWILCFWERTFLLNLGATAGDSVLLALAVPRSRTVDAKPLTSAGAECGRTTAVTAPCI